LILELLNRGVRVPADVAITGFDNLPVGQAYSIGVTTYAFSAESVARQDVRLILARAAGDAGPPVKVLIPGELIVRESSRPPATPSDEHRSPGHRSLLDIFKESPPIRLRRARPL
jgi:LacI family transcriptional regulator